MLQREAQHALHLALAHLARDPRPRLVQQTLKPPLHEALAVSTPARSRDPSAHKPGQTPRRVGSSKPTRHDPAPNSPTNSFTNSQREPACHPWRWTAVLIQAPHQTLRPSPGLVALFEATRRGALLRILDERERECANRN